MSDYRNVLALIAAVGLLQLSGGILGIITPIGLEALGANATIIGIIGALYSADFMAGAAMMFGPNWLFGFSAALNGILVIATLVRRESRDAVAEDGRENWEMTRPTSLISAEFDPRIKPDTDDIGPVVSEA